ncbi:T9SS type B sorting domain-containing protein [Flavobacterium sp. MC2016-06]|uniref:T9SS type B sorting domain-containing protein n=1 Tax=Flavobacterium sp. MC2016-06 TaxID=2676308 RepID=UPI0031DF3104
MKRILLLFFFIFSTFCYSQEICNNGIDDDGDGKIDLNDSDCVCNKTASILANSSFEEKTHCPYDANDLSPVISWVKGTQPSPDYINCQKYNIIYDKKLNDFPDGDGIIRAAYKNSRKEYLATKLQTPLIAGTKYQLKLNIATLTTIETSSTTEYDFDYLEPVNITLFGCNNRDNLPLYTNSSPNEFDSTWIEIGHATYQPQSKWGEITITFTPNVDINSIMLGAPSGKLPPLFDTLEYLSMLYDKLDLNTAENFGVTISQTGSFCDGNLELTASLLKNLNSTTTYQWYKDGIAIIGAVNKIYNVPSITTNAAAYSVKITNGSDCFISSNLTINNSLPSPDATVVQPTCIEKKGSITVKETGLNYSFDNGKTWQTDPRYIPVGPGKYYVKTKSTSGCISTPSIITIIDPILLERPSFSIIQPTCSTNGSITITTPASQFSFDDGITWSTNATKNNLPVGNYNIKIKNNFGCESYTRSVFLFTPHIDYPQFTYTVPTCSTGGSITITTPASEYSFDNGATWTTNPTAANLDPGYYLIKIKNEYGCESNSPLEYIYLKKFYVPTPKVKKVEVTCGHLGSITILTVADQYSFDNGATWTNNPKAENLNSGYYIIKTKNELDCESEPNYVLLNPFYLPPANFKMVQATCTVNGSITITTPAAEYSFDRGLTWSTNPTAPIPPVFSSFFVVIKNEFGCTSEPQYAYIYPDLYSGLDTTYKIDKEITCDSGASITITSPGSEFSFEDFQPSWTTNPTAANLKAGYYTLQSRNSNGCITNSKRIYIADLYLDFPTYTVIQPDCNHNGSITITTPAALYSFDNGETWGTNPTKSNLEEGNYDIVVKNELGCISYPSFIHIFPFYLQPPTFQIIQPTDCGDNATGSIIITSQADFYSFNDGATWSTNPVGANLPVGSQYRIKTKNNNGCVSQSIYLNFTPFELGYAHYLSTSPTCDQGGTITITTPAPFYSFDGGETWGTNPIALNLPAGYYIPKIKTESGCISPSYYNIRFDDPKLSYPTVRVIQPKCGVSGSVIVDTPAAQYSFDGGRTWSNSNQILNIKASTNTSRYYIITKDESGCESYQTVSTIYPVYLDPPDYSTTKPTCQLGGSISIDPIGAEYSFDNGLTWSSNPTATDLEEGNHFIILKNALGCESYPLAVYIPKFYLDEPLFAVTQPNCEGLGSIKVTTPASEYSIDNGINWVSNSTISNLKPGNYYLKIKDSFGCESNSKYISLYDLNPSPEQPNVSVQQPSSCTSPKGIITVSTNAYQYSFDDGLTWTTNSKATDLVSGTYFVKIKNSAAGCPSASTKTIINTPLDAITTPNYIVNQPISCTNPFGTISITTIAAKYSFDNGLSWRTNADSGNLAIGSYMIKIQNSAGCESEAVSIQINPPADFPSIPTYSTIQPDCSNNQGKITILSLASEYSFNNGVNWNTNATSAFLNAGEYSLKTKNSNGCISETVKATITPFINSIPTPENLNPKIFCIQENATLNNISTTNGQNIKWYDTLTGGIILPNNTLLQNDKTYFASQTINGCESERTPVTIKIQDTTAPTGDANQLFCTGQNPTLENIVVTGENIKWYDGLTNGNLLANNANLQNGITYYASQTINACESQRLAVMVSIQNTPSVPRGNTNPQFCKSENATLGNISLNGQNLKWYDSNFSAATLPNNTFVQNNTTYYVSQTIGCESYRIPVLVNVYDSALPIANTPQTFCIDENAVINTIAVTGQSLKWYDAPSAGNILANTTTLENKTYYVTQTTNNCESLRLAITIKIQDTQVPVVEPNQSFCIQQNATINTIKISGQDIKWYNAFAAGSKLSESTPLENAITYYASQTINNCESERTAIRIQILEALTTDCINFEEELPFPKFFTPNNDGYNDTWTINFAYLAPNSSIKIFDRYGKFIKELNLNSAWDGTYVNQDEPASDYWFTATRLNGIEFRSHFSLKR